MSISILYLPEAREDIDVAYAGYEQRIVGLGDRFLDALRKCVDPLLHMPALYGIVEEDIRAAPLRRFPYVVFYRVETTRILVIAVQHGSRSWKGWRDRA